MLRFPPQAEQEARQSRTASHAEPLLICSSARQVHDDSTATTLRPQDTHKHHAGKIDSSIALSIYSLLLPSLALPPEAKQMASLP